MSLECPLLSTERDGEPLVAIRMIGRKKPTDFFDLPPVLRQQVYSYLLSPEETYRSDMLDTSYDFHPAILSVNKRFRQDAGEFVRLYCQIFYVELRSTATELIRSIMTFAPGVPMVTRLPRTVVSPTLSVVIVGERSENPRVLRFYTGKEGLFYIVSWFWQTCAESSNFVADRPQDVCLSELRSHTVKLTLHKPNASVESQLDYLNPFWHMHLSSPPIVEGQVDPAIEDLFERALGRDSSTKLSYPDIFFLFDSLLRKGREFYRLQRYYEAYSQFDLFDRYGYYLDRLRYDHLEYRNLVSWLHASYEAWVFEAWLGCQMSAIHAGEWELAISPRQSFCEQQYIHSDTYRRIRTSCRLFAKFCEGKASMFANLLSSQYEILLNTDFEQVEDLMLDLASAKDCKGVTVADYETFRRFKRDTPGPEIGYKLLERIHDRKIFR